jgi:hypothetical protein
MGPTLRRPRALPRPDRPPSAAHAVSREFRSRAWPAATRREVGSRSGCRTWRMAC